MSATKETFPVTVILVKDEVDNGFTAFFAQFPNIIADGENEERATANLFRLVKEAFLHQQKEEIASAKSHTNPESLTTRSFDLAIA